MYSFCHVSFGESIGVPGCIATCCKLPIDHLWAQAYHRAQVPKLRPRRALSTAQIMHAAGYALSIWVEDMELAAGAQLCGSRLFSISSSERPQTVACSHTRKSRCHKIARPQSKCDPHIALASTGAIMLIMMCFMLKSYPSSWNKFHAGSNVSHIGSQAHCNRCNATQG